MKIAIYGRQLKPGFTETISFLFNLLEINSIEVVVYKAFHDQMVKDARFRSKAYQVFESHEDIDTSINFFFSIGGDGTFLEAVSFVRDKQIPLVGINTGRLGFLANISQNEIPVMVQAILSDDFGLEERSLLQLNTQEQLFGDFNFALNEATILKKDTSSMITIHVYMEDVFLNSYWADGLIIATPSGSTAYSLSAGGPIVVPNSKNFVITPLAPHNLTVRPLIIPDDKELTLRVDGRSETFLTSLDYRSATFEASLELKIKKANFTVSVLKLAHHNFFGTLRGKLMWGVDKRN